MSMDTEVTCQECGTLCGGSRGKDTYAHMLGCLNVAPGHVERIREGALASRTDNGARVAYLCDAILASDTPVPVSDY